MTLVRPVGVQPVGGWARRWRALRQSGLPYWASLGHLCLGLVVGVVWWPVGVVLVAASAGTPGPERFTWADALARRLLRAEMSRFDALLGAKPVEPRREPWADFGDRGFQGVVSYVLVRPLVSAVEALAIVGLVALPLALSVYVVIQEATHYPGPSTVLLWAMITLGLVGRFVIPVVARVDVQIATVLLDPDGAALRQRLGEAVEARRRTVDAAERERERIERDLHDGAQQRLIALSILLGRAEQKLQRGDADPAATLASVQEAKRETLAVIADIRGLTQGLRPAVLEARGLDAALSVVVGRLGLACDVDVRLDPRPGEATEGVLYFALSELLTNVAKHARARSASVTVRRDEGVLVASVRDDGVGGADPQRGSGLRGIADRLAGIDGRLFVSSPPGGPTLITVEVPCAS